MSWSLRVGAVVASLATTTFAPALVPEIAPTAAPSTFAMCVDSSGVATPPRWQALLMAATAASLDSQDRLALGGALEAANVRWEARANPLTIDFEDESPDAKLEEWLAHAPAAVGVARSAATAAWCATDGFCVRVVEAGHACPAGSHPADTSERGRARFIAWPFGHALRLRAASAEDARASASTLRAKIGEARSIGLVIHPSDGDSNEPNIVSLRQAWDRHEKLKGLLARSSTTSTTSATNATSSEVVRPDDFAATLPPTDIVVLPRLAAVADEGAMEREILRSQPHLRVVSR